MTIEIVPMCMCVYSEAIHSWTACTQTQCFPFILFVCGFFGCFGLDTQCGCAKSHQRVSSSTFFVVAAVIIIAHILIPFIECDSFAAFVLFHEMGFRSSFYAHVCYAQRMIAVIHLTHFLWIEMMRTHHKHEADSGFRCTRVVFLCHRRAIILAASREGSVKFSVNTLLTLARLLFENGHKNSRGCVTLFAEKK